MSRRDILSFLAAGMTWMYSSLFGCDRAESTLVEIPIPGAAAWDFNEDGECDESEDANGDGRCDGRDLLGAPGQACWDQNANGQCDVEREDVDGDGACSSLDCRPQLVTTGVVDGWVGDSYGRGLSGAQVTLSPGPNVTTTAADGTFSLTLTFGWYEVAVTAEGYGEVRGVAVSVLPGETVSLGSIVLEGGESPITAEAGPDQLQLGFGATVILEGRGSGADNLSFRWRQTKGVRAVITGRDRATPTVTLPTLEEVYEALDRELPDRTELLGIGPLTQGAITLELEVSSGELSTTDSVTLRAAETTLPSPAVPLGLNLFALAAAADDYAWTLVGPETSVAQLRDADGRTPSFIPDVPGTYRLSLSKGPELVVYAGEWEGVVGDTEECTTCHGGGQAPDHFPGWAQTDHATVFGRIVDGQVSRYYRASCIGCHALGNSPVEEVRSGFRDVAAATGWTFPSTFEPGNWAELQVSNPALARLANVQCESCHGPHSTDAHQVGYRVSYDAGVCGACHDRSAESGISSQWQGSSHAELSLARRVASVDRLGPTAGDCGRCHSAQGFVAYTTKLLQGEAGSLAPEKVALQALGLNDREVEPVTCVACHDPHSSANDYQLRLQDQVPLVAGGFPVNGAGRGAVCVACHNSAMGPHDDFHPPTGYQSPEVSTQSDILYARNAYFVTPGGVGADSHAALGDACVTCHMAQTDEEDAPRVGGHSLRVPENLCVDCHGEGVTGSGVRGIVQQNQQALQEDLLAQLMDELAASLAGEGEVTLRAWNPATRCFTSSGDSDVVLTEMPRNLALENINRSFGLSMSMPREYTLNWGSPRCSGSSTTDTLFFQLESLEQDGAPVFEPGHLLLKAMWNLKLIQADGTSGLHNPGWVMDVLGRTREVLWAR